MLSPPSIRPPFMEMVVKQFSPFMELLVQLCLTTCATMSYCLCNRVLLLVQLCLTACASVFYCLCKCVLLFVQLCLTTCATVSYCLCKWLASSPPIYGNGFRSSTSENQRLHKELSNSEIGLHTDLGNFRTEKALLKQELVELRSQFETECADRDQWRTIWLKRKNCIGSGKNKKSAPIAIGVELRSRL
jgi:hypothetical protein